MGKRPTLRAQSFLAHLEECPTELRLRPLFQLTNSLFADAEPAANLLQRRRLHPTSCGGVRSIALAPESPKSAAETAFRARPSASCVRRTSSSGDVSREGNRSIAAGKSPDCASRLISLEARTGSKSDARSGVRPDIAASFSGSVSPVVRYARASARLSPLVVPRRTTRQARTTYSRISARIQYDA